MTHNDDFSFVRFLKVVRTLYESSTFTQLGKTVGSALNYQPPQMFIEEEKKSPRRGMKDESIVVGTVITDEKKVEDNDAQSTLIDVLAACTSTSGKGGKGRGLRAMNARTAATTTTSLLEQVMNCTYAHTDDPYSDDETYQTKEDRSYCSQTIGDSTTYDSATDDGYESHRGGRGRSRRRRGRV